MISRTTLVCSAVFLTLSGCSHLATLTLINHPRESPAAKRQSEIQQVVFKVDAPMKNLVPNKNIENEVC